MKERIKLARKHAGIASQVELAAKLTKLVKREIPAQTIQSLESGRVENSKYTPQIAMICGVSAEWLADEIGPMIPDGRDHSTEEERRLLDAFRKLHVDSVRDHMIRLIESISSLPGYIQAATFAPLNKKDQQRINKRIEKKQAASRSKAN